jgi:hypothetical protein
VLRPWEKRAIELRDRYCVSVSPGEGWALVGTDVYGHIWDHQKLGIRVLQTVAEAEGQIWLHTSVSRPKRWRLPTYEDVVKVKRFFVGEDRPAFQYFVPSDQHVNLTNVLHLYTPLDAPGLNFPDFRVEVAPGVFDLK